MKNRVLICRTRVGLGAGVDVVSIPDCTTEKLLSNVSQTFLYHLDLLNGVISLGSLVSPVFSQDLTPKLENGPTA